MATKADEKVFKGYGNQFKIIISQGGAPVDFSSATRMTLDIGGFSVDTNDDSNLITWDSLGEISFDIGGVTESVIGTYNTTLIAYDPEHPEGQIICHPSGNAELDVEII